MTEGQELRDQEQEAQTAHDTQSLTTTPPTPPGNYNPPGAPRAP